MGFEFNMLIVHPERGRVLKEDPSSLGRPELARPGPSKQYTIWSIDAVISVGRVTGISKIERCSHVSFAGRMRAGMCLVDMLYPKVVQKAEIGNKDHFTPPFMLMFSEDGMYRSFWEWSKIHLEFSKLVEGAQFLRPLYGIRSHQQIPSQKLMEEHNAVIALSQRSFAKRVAEKYGIIREVPFPWESCETLAKWMHEMEVENTKAWKELVKEPKALAHFRSWRAYLEEVGQVGARAILFFDEVNHPTFV